jgi:hypothetical protein
MFLSASFSGRVEQQFKNFVSMICDMELCKEIPSSSFFFLHGVQRLFFGAEEEDWLSPTLRPSKSSMDRKKPSRRREIPWTLFTLHLPTLRCLSSPPPDGRSDFGRQKTHVKLLSAAMLLDMDLHM